MLKSKIKKVAVVGAGGWGTALSTVLSDNGYKVILWAFEEEVARGINLNHQNSMYLPGVTINDKIKVTNSLNDLFYEDLYIFTVPTQHIRSILKKIKLNKREAIIVNGAKGIETGTLYRPSEIFNECLDLPLDNFVVLTGPSHAEEVARKLPTTVVSASTEHSSALIIQKLLNNEHFRVYTTDDVIGCELGGALKNVIAIAAGIIDGLGLGDNTKAALITRGLAEISRLGIALGAKPITFSGLSGLGDLTVTCNSKYSRNRYVGEEIGKGKKLGEIINNMKMIAEGIPTTESAYFLSKKHKVEMPITEQMYKILFEDYSPILALKELMNRQSKKEWWW